MKERNLYMYEKSINKLKRLETIQGGGHKGVSVKGLVQRNSKGRGETEGEGGEY